MPDQEEERLVAACKVFSRLNLAAWDSLIHPMHSVLYGREIHRQRIQTHATARKQYLASLTVLRAYRSNMKARPIAVV